MADMTYAEAARVLASIQQGVVVDDEVRAEAIRLAVTAMLELLIGSDEFWSIAANKGWLKPSE